MSDIVERLRTLPQRADILPWMREAADEIERLTMQVDALNKALCKSGDERTQQAAEIAWLRAALQEIADLRYDNTSAATIAQKALKP